VIRPSAVMYLFATILLFVLVVVGSPIEHDRSVSEDLVLAPPPLGANVLSFTMRYM
jgi:hypothetical protein